MSSTLIDYTNISTADILSIIDKSRMEICRRTGSDSSVLPVKTKVRKTHANKGKPNARGDFCKKICEEHKAEYETFKEEHKEQKGAHLTWMSAYMKEHKDEYEAFKAAWALQHPKTTDADTDAADAAGESNSESQTTEEKPAKVKKVLSPEHLAKMKAGREAKLAEKKAAKEQQIAAAEANAPFTMAAVEAQQAAETAAAIATAPVQAKKGPKKVTKKAEAAANTANAANAVPLMVGGGGSVQPPIVAEPEGEVEPLPFKHKGITYIRIGTAKSDGTIDWASSDLWYSKKGQRGAYVGELMPDGDINEDAEEPNLI
jgi:hypothetical protein